MEAFDRGWILLGIPKLLNDRQVSWANIIYYAGAGGIEGLWNSGCLLLAGAIAWGQVYQERRRKTWPLLAHLPIPRSRTIFAKVLAGLLMYLIVCLPLALLIIARLNTPGMWPGPIYAYMFFPLLTYFLAGAMFYLATFLSAFRLARWYATKWLPLMAAIPVYIVAESLEPAFLLLGDQHGNRLHVADRAGLGSFEPGVCSLGHSRTGADARILKGYHETISEVVAADSRNPVLRRPVHPRFYSAPAVLE